MDFKGKDVLREAFIDTDFFKGERGGVSIFIEEENRLNQHARHVGSGDEGEGYLFKWRVLRFGKQQQLCGGGG